MAYQPCRCSVTLLCPVCISVFCTHLALSVLLHLYSLHHVPSMQPSSAVYFYSCALPPCSHFNPSTQRPQQLQQQWQQQPHLFSVPCTYSFCAPCTCNVRLPLHAHTAPISSTSRVLCLIIMVTLQLLWQFSHAFNITGCYAEIPQPLWQLRLFVFSVTVELILSVSITSSFSSRIANHTQSVSFSFIHTPMAVPLPISLGKRKTTVQATERPTETLTDLQSCVRFANRIQTQ
jgi:hypothetical protein